MTLFLNVVFLVGIGCLIVAIASSLWGLAGAILMFAACGGFALRLGEEKAK